jgi:hypothetical protein
MGLTVTKQFYSHDNMPASVPDLLAIVILNVASDATYPASGETLDLSSYFSGVPYSVHVTCCGGYIAEYIEGSDASDGTLFIYHCDYDAVADGPLVENTTTDISAATAGFRVTAYGLKA